MKRPFVLATVAVVSLLSLAACADTGITESYSSSGGTQAAITGAEVRNVTIVSQAAGSGRLIAGVFTTTEAADVLASVEVSGSTREAPSSATVRQVLPGFGAVYYGANASVRGAKPAIPLTLSASLRPGKLASVTFVFARAGRLTLQVPVVAAAGEYANTP
ncbi:MAG TPA: hypothetical protein DHW34_04645 [Actinobacteria bacterium]|nr:hypothetical protein [Actinomycetota bacterium]HCK79286.1 hypothetical protein [Actinomycetota bacterium]